MAIVMNKTAISYMGLQNPVGKVLRDGEGEGSIEFKIIGVIDDMIMQSPYDPVKPSIYFFDREYNASFYNLRLNPEKSTTENLEIIEGVFKKNFPNIPFDYQFHIFFQCC